MATSCTSASTSRRLSAGLALAAIAFDCAKGDYTYARRTLTLAGVVVDDRAIPPSRWASQRFPVPVKGSIPALALERFCAPKDVPAK